MKKNTTIKLLTMALFAATLRAFAATTATTEPDAGIALKQPAQAPTVAETPAQRDARMAWWREAKFGLFIHWGVYSVPAGYYQGNPVPKIGEWIMFNAKIPMAEYQAFAREFNPVKFNADDWVKAAKDAGMKYIVITTKHHDGFAMFCSQASKWNICDASPYGKDPLQDLAAACRKYGMRLGFYYSQAQDWNNGGAVGLGSMGTNAPPRWDSGMKTNMDEYIDKIAVPQVKELCSNYGEFPDIIWWDTPRDMNPERAQKLLDAVHALRPNVIMNNRLGGGVKGDTETPEQKIPAKGLGEQYWETCMTLNDTWGFKKDDSNWKSTEMLIRNLCDVASKGGNYLLNVGPTSEGLIPQASLGRLAGIGKWMQVNGEAIYGSSVTCFGAELGKPVKAKDGYGRDTMVSSANDWRCTTKPGKIYLEIFQWPTNQKFELPRIQSNVTRAYLLADKKSLDVSQTDAGVTISLPAQAPDKIASVVCLEVGGQLPGGK